MKGLVSVVLGLLLGWLAMPPAVVAAVAPTEGVHVHVYGGHYGTTDVSTPDTERGPPSAIYDFTLTTPSASGRAVLRRVLMGSLSRRSTPIPPEERSRMWRELRLRRVSKSARVAGIFRRLSGTIRAEPPL